MQPTAHFRAHHEVEEPRIDLAAFRPAWRVRFRLDMLLVTRAISPREWFAAVTYRQNWNIAFGHALESTGKPARGSSRISGDHYTARRLDALAALKMVSRGIGPVKVRLIEACAVHDLSWRALGAQLRLDPRTARSRTIFAIKMLTRFVS
jgi:hypothetical protein